MDKRLWLFIVLSVLVYAGWFGLQAWLLPPPPKPPEPAAKPAPVDKIVAALNGDDGYPLRWLTMFLGASERLGVLHVLPDSKVILAKVEEARKAEAQKIAQIKAPLPDKEIRMGGPGYKLDVALRERNAAVSTITLNHHFQASKLDARPVYKNNDKKTPAPLVLVSDDANPDQQSYRFLVDGAPLSWSLVGKPSAEKAVFEASVPGRDIKVTKTFSLRPGQYHIDMEIALARTAPGKQEFVYQITGPHGLPAEGDVWRTLPSRRGVVGTVDPKDRRSLTRMVFDPPTIRDEKDEPPNLEGPDAKSFQYGGVMLQYFAALLVVDAEPDQAPPAIIAKFDAEYVGDDPDVPPNHAALQGRLTTRVTSRPLKLLGEQPTIHHYLLYAGPTKVRLLGYEAGVEDGLADRYENILHLGTLTDYTDYPGGPWATIGWTGLLVFFTNIMHGLLEMFHKVVGYYGVAILLLTLVVRGAMFPISRKQAMSAKKMQALKPEIDKLKAKHSDRQALAQAQMELYRKHGINPMSGCLTIFLQMPIFMGLYYALNESVHLRLSGFLWIENLAAPDMLFYWGDNAVTRFLHLGPYFNLLPILSIALMFVQQKLLAPPPADDQQALQMKMMNYMMIFFGYMFYWVASGLCLYFIMSSLWGLAERKLLPKFSASATTAPAEPAAKQAKRGDSRNGQDEKGPGLRSKLGNWWSRLLEEAKKK